jgi:hypothetical protein
MPINDIDTLAADTMDGSQMILVIKKPETERVQLTGLVNGTNAVFTFPATHYPIGATTYKRIVPIADDVTVETLKTATYTEVTVTSVDTITDPDTGFTVYGKVTLAAAPSVEGTDTVWATCTVEHDVYVQQSIKPKLDQDTKDIERMGSRSVYQSFGKIKTSYDVDVILADLEAIYLGNFDEATSQTGVQTGHTLYELRDKPLLMDGYVPIYSGDEVEDPKDRTVHGYIMLEGITKAPVLPEGSANDNLTATLTLAVGEKPYILAKD